MRWVGCVHVERNRSSGDQLLRYIGYVQKVQISLIKRNYRVCDQIEKESVEHIFLENQ